MYKCIISSTLFFISLYSFAQIDSVIVEEEEYDTIIVVKEPLIIEQKVYFLKEPSKKKYSLLFYSSVGFIFNYMSTCDCYSKKSFERALKSQSYFTFTTALSKKIKKRFGVEVGLSIDYMRQTYSYSDTSSVEPIAFKNNTIYSGILAHGKYYIIPAERTFNLAVYAGGKGLFALSQKGNMYDIAMPAIPANNKDNTQSFVYGLSGRLEANVQTGRYAKIFFGMNYYYDLIPYTLAGLDYYLQRNIVSAFIGYRMDL